MVLRGEGMLVGLFDIVRKILAGAISRQKFAHGPSRGIFSGGGLRPELDTRKDGADSRSKSFSGERERERWCEEWTQARIRCCETGRPSRGEVSTKQTGIKPSPHSV